MSRAVHVVGVGMVPFTKPRETQGYDRMGEQAAVTALTDAGVAYDQVQQAYAGYVYGDSTSGQAALYRLFSCVNAGDGKPRPVIPTPPGLPKAHLLTSHCRS